MKRYIITIDSDSSLDELMEVLGSLNGFSRIGKTALKTVLMAAPQPSEPSPEPEAAPSCKEHKWVDNVLEDGNRVVECEDCGEDRY